jgi:predicted TIM-barrel fold metal-dependent hydrolase
LVGIAQLPAVGVQAAIDEMHRAKELGLRGVLISAWPSGAVTLTAAEDPFFAAAEKIGMPVSLHIGLAKKTAVQPKKQGKVEQHSSRGEAAGGRTVSVLSGAGLDTMPLLLGEIILTGVHDRFPKLQFVSVEAGIGWIPYYVEQMNDRYERNHRWAKIKLDREPGAYLKSNWFFTFVIDHYGVKNRHEIGIDRIMWSTDYPHHGCDWPRSRDTIARMFEGVSEAERRQVTHDNAAKLYDISATA